MYKKELIYDREVVRGILIFIIAQMTYKNLWPPSWEAKYTRITTKIRGAFKIRRMKFEQANPLKSPPFEVQNSKSIC